MTKRLIKFPLLLLALCFAIGVAGATYHDCNAEKAPAQAQAMAGMDCHKASGASSTFPKKKCCTDFSCLKCFSSPLATVRAMEIEMRAFPSVLTASTAGGIMRYDSSAPERPPKMA